MHPSPRRPFICSRYDVKSKKGTLCRMPLCRTLACRTKPSIVELQRKLDDPPPVPDSRDLPEIRVTGKVQVRGIVELRVVEHIESLRPELEVIRFPYVEL